MNAREFVGEVASAERSSGAATRGARHMFRLWIAAYQRWQPQRWNDVPPRATAVELIEDASFSEEEARLFLEGFNSQMLAAARSLWAVAVPVVIRFEGDAQPGDAIRGHAFPE